MKKTLITLFFVALVTLGFIAVVQSSRVAHRQKELALARSEQAQAQREAEELQAANQRLKREREALRDRIQHAPAPAPQPATPARSAAEAATAAARAPGQGSPSHEPDKASKDAAGMGNFLTKMLDDPDTRKFIRDQQRQMMDPLYAPLLKRLDLTPEQAAQLKDFIADTQMKGAAAATSLMGGSSSNRTEMLTTLAAEQKTADEQIKAFLGEERYALYQDYQLTLGERMQLQQFKTQNAGGESALTDQQTEMLLALMKEEKQNVAAVSGPALAGTGDKPVDMQAILSGEKTEQILQLQEQVYQRVYERARTVLPEPQLNTFGKFQTNQMQMIRLGMSMAKKMFAPEGGTAQPGQ